MAQVNAPVVTELRNTILKIANIPRGGRSFSEMSEKATSSLTKEDGKEQINAMERLKDVRIFNSVSKYFESEAPFQLDHILLSGSYSEGTQRCNFEKKLFSDTDFLLVLKNINVSENEQKQGNLTVREDTPFVKLYVTDEELIKTWADFLETSTQPRCGEKAKISSMKLKERLREKYMKHGQINMPLNEEDVGEVDEGPSVAVFSKVPGKGEVTGHNVGSTFEEFDLVLAINCDGWPLCAQEWQTRARRWPTQDFVEKIANGGFYIVLKGSTYEACNFRLSFYNAETLLVENLRILQFKVYRAFKSFVNHFKNNWSPNVKRIFCSYHLKTIVLWYCEKTGTRDWNEDTVVSHFLSLIDELIWALKERTLPMYFMPKYNLMEKIENGAEVAEKIQEIRFNLPLISEAIISEEPNLESYLKHVNTELFPGYFDMIRQCSEKGKMELSDLWEYFKSLSSTSDEFWMNVAGRIPPYDEEEAAKAVSVLNDAFIKIVERFNQVTSGVNINELRPVTKE